MNEWTWGNDTPVWMSPRRTVYFIYRRAEGGGTEYLQDKRGIGNGPNIRFWKSAAAVKKALAKV
jgi:hypothetical protein